MDELLRQLKRRLRGTIMVVGIGNTIKSDDGVGPYVVNALSERMGRRESVKFIDAGELPENFIGKIVRMNPDTVVLIDAVDFSPSKAGDIKILDSEDIKDTTVSTHNLSLKLFMQQIQDAGASVVMIGIRPSVTILGEGLSINVKQKADELIEVLAQIMSEECNARADSRKAAFF